MPAITQGDSLCHTRTERHRYRHLSWQIKEIPITFGRFIYCVRRITITKICKKGRERVGVREIGAVSQNRTEPAVGTGNYNK